MKQIAIGKNIAFFKNRHASYAQSLSSMDTYEAIRKAVALAVKGAKKLLDVGHGLIFDYDVSKINSVVALDLFATNKRIANMEFKKGSALDLPEKDASFDTVILEMVLHHLVGKTVDESIDNVHLAIFEAWRVLEPGGRLIIVESCIPNWFFTLEKIVYMPVAQAVSKLLTHPMAIQYPQEFLKDILKQLNQEIKITKIPKGDWLLQFGFPFPGWLSPVEVWMFEVHKDKKSR